MSISPGGLAEASGSGTVAALNGAVTASVPYASTILFSITGTWVGTLVVEGSVDGTNFFQWAAYDALTGVQAQSITANAQLWTITSGLLTVRVRASSWTSGTATLSWNADSGSVTLPGGPAAAETIYGSSQIIRTTATTTWTAYPVGGTKNLLEFTVTQDIDAAASRRLWVAYSSGASDYVVLAPGDSWTCRPRNRSQVWIRTASLTASFSLAYTYES